MVTAEEIKAAMEDVFWRESGASISSDGKKVTMMVENWDRPSSDEPYAYEFEFEVGGEFYCTGVGGNGRNWGIPYDGAGLDTQEKVRYACECAYDHDWRNWGGM